MNLAIFPSFFSHLWQLKTFKITFFQILILISSEKNTHTLLRKRTSVGKFERMGGMGPYNIWCKLGHSLLH
jgi:hypothetical protein